MLTLILCAILCGLCLSWILAPKLQDKKTLAAAFILAAISIALYLFI